MHPCCVLYCPMETILHNNTKLQKKYQNQINQTIQNCTKLHPSIYLSICIST